MKAPAFFEDTEAKKEINRLCKENLIDITLIKDLCEAVGQHTGASRRESIMQEITECIDRFMERE